MHLFSNPSSQAILGVLFIIIQFVNAENISQTDFLSAPNIVQTRYGPIEGTFDGISRDGLQFYQFIGIQYAVVQKRFESAETPKPWSEKIIKSAKEFGPACVPVEENFDENCLFLNVYTPETRPSRGNLKPVIVFIHGGSFKLNSGNHYGPNYWMDQDVVFVTINYRLGVLGFLSTGDENAPGNYGLKDQVMALKWIRDNIGRFGGDKDKVTLTGQSAGSASVTYHLLSPMSKGLFHYAVAQSGTFLDPWAFTRKPVRYAQKVAELVGCYNKTDSKTFVNCLREVPAKTLGDYELLRSASVKFFEEPLAAFGPVIEPYIGNGSNTFLSESPYELLNSGNIANKVPLLTGITNAEGIYIWAAALLYAGSYAVEARENLQANWTTYAPLAFYFDETAEPQRVGEIAKKVEDFYFPAGFSLNDSSTFNQLTNLYTDRIFVASAVHFINLYSKHAPTYPYLYTYDRYVGLEFGLFLEFLEEGRNMSIPLKGATHGAELDMLMSPFFNRTRDSEDFEQVSKNILKIWTSFAKTGAPIATYGSERNFLRVDPKKGLEKWYSLDEDTKLIENIFAERVAFWESLKLHDYEFDYHN
ncbi:unnamed protein product [Orchesella dallaii]|uniref:Carboxylic ester hydrolase n=1 Tax=Orchesella dallaii TaxID=48710 RepID=A0ABP1RIJ3_9HEXA